MFVISRWFSIRLPKSKLNHRRSTRQAFRSFRPDFERLEERTVMSAVPPIAAGHWEGTVQQSNQGRLASDYTITLDLVQNGNSLSGTERIESSDGNHYYEEREVSGAITPDPKSQTGYGVTLTDGAMIDPGFLPEGAYWYDCVRTFQLPVNPSDEVDGTWSYGIYHGTLELQHVDAAFNTYSPDAYAYIPEDMPPFAGSRDDISPGVSSGANSAPAVNNSNQLPPTDMPSGVTDSGTTDPHGSSSGQGYLKATITHNELVEDPGEPFSFARLPIAAPGDAVSGAPDAHRSFGEEVGRILNAAPDLGNAVLGGARNVASFYSLSPEEQDRLIEDFVDTYGTGLQAIQKDPSAAAQIYVRTVSNMTNDAPQIAAMEGAGSMVNALGKGGELTDIIVNAMAKNDKLAGVVRKFGKRYFPTSGATPKEVEIINDFVDDTGLKPGIRATDPVSAYRTQQATNRGVSAKPFTIKENTKLGTMEKELPSGVVKEYRGDLDIAYVYDPKRGRLLTDIETLTEVVGPLNKRLRKAGLKPSFRHGGHATASEAKNIKTWKDLMEIPASPGPVIEHAGKDLAGNYTKPQLMTSDDVLRMFARKRRGPALPDKLGD